MFAVREGIGVVRWTPWKTFSETVWDVEKYHPGTKRQLLAFTLGLAVHIRYRTELRPALQWAEKHVDEFDVWLEQHGGD
jgi:hypothetical protein